jgi:hypothetical protein
LAPRRIDLSPGLFALEVVDFGLERGGLLFERVDAPLELDLAGRGSRGGDGDFNDSLADGWADRGDLFMAERDAPLAGGLDGEALSVVAAASGDPEEACGCE